MPFYLVIEDYEAWIHTWKGKDKEADMGHSDLKKIQTQTWT